MMLARQRFVHLCRARDRLREIHDRQVPIRQVAREAAVSPFHFIKQFQAVFGETPHQFRIRARLERAKALLALSDWTVTEICFEVGLSSLGSFSDLFARRIGMAPSAYRRQVRSRAQVPGELPAQLTPGCLMLMGAAFATFEKRPPVVPGHPVPASACPVGPAAQEDS